ncbi:hypothetical protein H0H93_012644 [Arthromyces matolae]|nr:hypothetical protein H0H93_012644 [Arthromyces matolae]
MYKFTRLFYAALLAAPLLVVSNPGTSLDGFSSDPQDAPYTNAAHIVTTLAQVNQKVGPAADEFPNSPVSSTIVTALDGNLSNSSVVGSVRRSIWSRHGSSVKHSLAARHKVLHSKRGKDGYVKVFNGTGTKPHDIHTEDEKTNFGGQQSEPAPAGLTYIQQSTGWASKTIADPPCPDGYELVYGPTDGANNAPGYMGFAFLDQYDVDACTTLCDNRDPDPQGGHCKFFNIWRALYYFPADSSTAVNYGQGDLKVTWSRGYRKRDACSVF